MTRGSFADSLEPGKGKLAERKDGEVDTDQIIEIRRIDQRYQTVSTAIRWIGAGVLAYFAVKAVGALAGARTAVSLAATIRVFASLSIVLTPVLVASAFAWAVRERRLRHRTVQHLQERIIEFERRLDGNRTSSGLTPTGQTNPQDRNW